MMTLILILFFGLCAYICHRLAQHYQLNPIFWGTLGFVFGPLAIIPLLIVAKSAR